MDVKPRVAAAVACAIATVYLAQPAQTATIAGHVLGAGGAIAGSTVTAFATTAGEPTQLAQAKTGADGSFTVDAAGGDGIVYLVAKGGHAVADGTSGENPALALMAVLGAAPPSEVVINEMTTVASVWTHAQFLDGTAIRGNALGLRIAAGNVPSFVDLGTGG